MTEKKTYNIQEMSEEEIRETAKAIYKGDKFFVTKKMEKEEPIVGIFLMTFFRDYEIPEIHEGALLLCNYGLGPRGYLSPSKYRWITEIDGKKIFSTIRQIDDAASKMTIPNIERD